MCGVACGVVCVVVCGGTWLGGVCGVIVVFFTSGVNDVNVDDDDEAVNSSCCSFFIVVVVVAVVFVCWVPSGDVPLDVECLSSGDDIITILTLTLTIY